MSDETRHNPVQPIPDPNTSSQPAAPTMTDAEAMRQFSDGKAPNAADRAPTAPMPDRDQRDANIGPVHAPVATDDLQERPDKTLYDRLADKDVTPTENSGGI